MAYAAIAQSSVIKGFTASRLNFSENARRFPFPLLDMDSSKTDYQFSAGVDRRWTCVLSRYRSVGTFIRELK